MEQFLQKLMASAKAAGISACEAYLLTRDSFSATVTDGEVNEYKSNSTRGLGFRGLKSGHMGYASTEAFDDEAIEQLVKGVCESAELSEDVDPEFLYKANAPVPKLGLCNEALNRVKPEEKVERVKEMERFMKAYDPRIAKTSRNTIRTGRYSVRIMNSYGMDRAYTEDMCSMVGMAMGKDGDAVSTSFFGKAGRGMEVLNAQIIGEEVAKRAVEALGAKPVPTGRYRVVFLNECMCDMLETFSGIFSAESAQKGLSLLKGRLDEKIAAPGVTLIDDPLMKNGLNSRPFDAEGVPSEPHTLIDGGVFKTFLHDLKTAHKDGVQSTGNAARAGYASSVHVAPSNLYFKAGKRLFKDLLQNVGEGLVITEVSGLHAGANAVSGDFSLLAKGYTIKGGKRGEPVEQITVAGNFYELLKNIREIGNDLLFPFGGIGSPSMDVGELSISGC